MKLAIATLWIVGVVVDSFSVTPLRTRSSIRISISSPLRATLDSDKLERAVKCAENFNLCDAEELETLADELEAFDESLERGQADATPASCSKEQQDRMDIVEILRMESELKNRHEYLKKANLFAENVHEQHNQQVRDEYLELLDKVADC